MTKHVRLDRKQLRKRCEMTFEDYAAEGGTLVSTEQVGRDGKPYQHRYIFHDNNASLLAVAHLDTVNPTTHFQHVNLSGEEWIYTQGLDDRLGAYIILDWLPKLIGEGQYDVLLTEGEENHNSSAKHFRPIGWYNWGFQFDRAGVDVVGYDYENSPEWEKSIRSAGAHKGRGSYTDIAELYHLRVLMFNWGCGYSEPHHARYARMCVNDTATNINRFIRFYLLYKDTYMPYEPEKYPKKTDWNQNYQRHYPAATVPKKAEETSAAKPEGAPASPPASDNPLPVTRVWQSCAWCGQWKAHKSGGMCDECYERETSQDVEIARARLLLLEAGNRGAKPKPEDDGGDDTQPLPPLKKGFGAKIYYAQCAHCSRYDWIASNNQLCGKCEMYLEEHYGYEG